MRTYTIKKGGKLEKTYWHFDEEKDEGQYLKKDVTDRAIQLMWEHCELEEGVTLRDIFLLLNTELEIFTAQIGNWCDEIVKEGLTKLNPKKKDNEVEYLELYWTLRVNNFGDKNETVGNLFPEFHGIGYELKEDDPDSGFKKGSRIGYAIEFTPANELIDLPVILKNEYVIYDERDWSVDNPATTHKFPNPQFSLGHILYGIIWEMSFCGSPEDRDEKRGELDKAVESIDKLDTSDATSLEEWAEEIKENMKSKDELH